MKKFLKFTLLVTLLFILFFSSYLKSINLTYSFNLNFSFTLESKSFLKNGEILNFTEKPLVLNGRVFIPLRDFLNASEIEYKWNEMEKSISFGFNKKDIKIFVKEGFYTFDGTRKEFLFKPVLFKNLTFISVRDISKIFDLNLIWDGKNKRVLLSGYIYPKITIKDDLYNEVTFYEKPKRIISLAPSNTEILFALGLKDEIIGVTEFCNYPEEAKKKEKIGGFSNPNLEKIYSLKPDFVFGIRGNPIDLFINLKKLNIKNLAFDPKSLDDLFNLILTIGKVVDKREEAKELVKNLNERRFKILEEAKKLKKRKVYLEIWNNPYMSVGKNTYLNEIIEEVGGINIASKATGDWPILSQEFIINENPEVIIITYMGQNIDDILKRPGWQNIDAVKNRRVYIFEKEDLIFRLGPRIIDGMEELFKLIHKDELSQSLREERLSSLFIR
ncbi:MAG: helical backbone metal receptor [Caldisericia bacterium]|jgi:iron complex transport system substrate-binding protein|nr:helical backbone metal receptor [Caldisericia bacterium]